MQNLVISLAVPAVVFTATIGSIFFALVVLNVAPVGAHQRDSLGAVVRGSAAEAHDAP